MCKYAQVAELVYAYDWGSYGAILGGSSPLLGTNKKTKQFLFCLFISASEERVDEYSRTQRPSEDEI